MCKRVTSFQLSSVFGIALNDQKLQGAMFGLFGDYYAHYAMGWNEYISW